MEEIGQTSRGYTIFREPNEAGGHRYWSDSIGGGVVVWDTSLASPEELQFAIAHEARMHVHPSIVAENSTAPRCGNCANWAQLAMAAHAGWCKLASGERVNHTGQNEPYGLLTPDMMPGCTAWMDKR